MFAKRHLPGRSRLLAGLGAAALVTTVGAGAIAATSGSLHAAHVRTVVSHPRVAARPRPRVAVGTVHAARAVRAADDEIEPAHPQAPETEAPETEAPDPPETEAPDPGDDRAGDVEAAGDDLGHNGDGDHARGDDQGDHANGDDNQGDNGGPGGGDDGGDHGGQGD